MKNTIILLALICCTSLTKAQSLAEAKTLTSNEQFEAASSMFKTIIEKFPSKGDYWFYYGESLLQNDNQDSAKYAYDEGTKNDPSNPLNYIGLGKISKLEKDAASAQQNFTKAINLGAGKNAEVFIRLAEAQIKIDKKDLTQGFTYLKDAEKLQPTNPEIQILNGDAFLENNDGSNAIKFYEKAQALDPKSPLALVRIGQLWTRARNYVGKDGAKGALEYYNNAIAIAPDYAPAYRELGELFAKAQRYEDAKKNYAKYLELSKNNLSAKIRYASFLFLTKNYKESLEQITSIWQKDTSKVVLYRLAAYSSFETKDPLNGLKYMETFLAKQIETKLIPSDFAYYGKLLAANGKDSLGILNINKAIEKDTATAVDLYSDLAAIYAKQKKHSEAILVYQKKIASGKAITNDYYRMGQSYYNLKEFGKADTAFSKVVETQPKLVTGYLWRARANSNIDPDSKLGLAKPFYEEYVIKAEPDSSKYLKELIEAYKYLGYYYYQLKDYTNSRIWWEKVKTIDPNDKQANDALSDMKGKG
jgi:tetratricopeptide (TPR) repeat protein